MPCKGDGPSLVLSTHKVIVMVYSCYPGTGETGARGLLEFWPVSLSNWQALGPSERPRLRRQGGAPMNDTCGFHDCALVSVHSYLPHKTELQPPPPPAPGSVILECQHPAFHYIPSYQGLWGRFKKVIEMGFKNKW